MKVIVTEDYAALSDAAAEMIVELVKSKPDAVLGLATGETPLGLYERLASDFKANGTSYKSVRVINLDEYKDLPASHPQSYARFMRERLFDRIDIQAGNTYIENGTAESEEEECRRYDLLLDKMPRDLQLLGLGSNGHIAFNEPGTSFDSTTHVAELSESTLRDNARLFGDISEVPRKAYTVGLESIMQAKKILILASGANKADAVRGMIRGEISENLPASILRRHADCVLIADGEAAAKL